MADILYLFALTLIIVILSISMAIVTYILKHSETEVIVRVIPENGGKKASKVKGIKSKHR